MTTTKQDCRGVVFQFNTESVLFEFVHEGEEHIGTVGLFKISLNAEGKKIPRGDGKDVVITVEDVSRYLQVGDEIICDVERRDGLPKFVYVEDEEEVTEFGDVTNRSHEVEIVPEWIASEAVLFERPSAVLEKTGDGGDGGDAEEGKAKAEVADNGVVEEGDGDVGGDGEESKEEFPDEEVIVLEDQLDDMFEDEIKQMEEEEKKAARKTGQERSSNDSSKPTPKLERKKGERKKEEEKEAKRAASTAAPTTSPLSSVSKDVVHARAKVLSLKPPVNKVGRQKVKVTSGIMEILDGRYCIF